MYRWIDLECNMSKIRTMKCLQGLLVDLDCTWGTADRNDDLIVLTLLLIWWSAAKLSIHSTFQKHLSLYWQIHMKSEIRCRIFAGMFSNWGVMKVLEQIRHISEQVNKVRPLKGWTFFFTFPLKQKVFITVVERSDYICFETITLSLWNDLTTNDLTIERTVH